MDTSIAANQLVLITGATDGIGKEASRELLRSGAHVLVHGRTHEKAAAVADELRADWSGGRTSSVSTDFTSLAAVRRLANEITESYPRLQILVNNAGAYSPARLLTRDGFEQTLQVQYLAPFLLTMELLTLLRTNAPARIVNVTSRLHRGAELDLALRGPWPYDGQTAYASSKLLLTAFTLLLAERLQGTGVVVNAVHPGGVDTKLLRAGFGGGGMSVEEGARPVVHLAASPAMGSVSGRYFERFKEADTDPRLYERSAQARIWQETERALGLTSGVSGVPVR